MRDRWYDRTDPQYLAYLNSREWKNKRKEVLRRCNGICERCGKMPVDEVHHLTYDRVYQELLEDLQGTCEYCHDFLHGKRKDDGTAAHRRLIKANAVEEKRIEGAREEIRRFEKHPGYYRTLNRTDFPSHRELIAFLRKHNRVLSSYTEGELFDVKYAKRKTPIVTVKMRFLNSFGDMVMTYPLSVEDTFFNGRYKLDTKRNLWLNIEDFRITVIRHENLKKSAFAEQERREAKWRKRGKAT